MPCMLVTWGPFHSNVAVIHSFSYKWEKVLRNISVLNKSCTHEPNVVRDGDLSLVKWPLSLFLKVQPLVSSTVLVHSTLCNFAYSFWSRDRDHHFPFLESDIGISIRITYTYFCKIPRWPSLTKTISTLLEKRKIKWNDHPFHWVSPKKLKRVFTYYVLTSALLDK